jgi:hypothetical protein
MERSTKIVGDRSPGAVQRPGTARPYGAKAAGPGNALSAETSGEYTQRRLTGSLITLLATSVVLLSAVLWHFAMVFLTLAPASSVTHRYEKQINGYIYPDLGQNWQMFAPNPLQQNVAIGARVQTSGTGGVRHTWDWVNLSASHIDAMRHNPLPSHLDQNMLRRAWDFYADNHNHENGRPIGMRGALSTQYLQRIALQRFGQKWHGERVVAVQVASRVNAVAPPRWSAQKVPENTEYHVLPWWSVKNTDYREL